MSTASTVSCDGCKKKIEHSHTISLFEQGILKGPSYFGGESKPFHGLDFCNIKCLDVWVKDLNAQS